MSKNHLDLMREQLEQLNKFCKHSNGISLRDYKEISRQISKIQTQLNQHQREMYLAVTYQNNRNIVIKELVETMLTESMTHAEKTGVCKSINHFVRNLSLPLIPHPPSCVDFDDEIPF